MILGTLKIAPQMSKPQQFGLLDESPYFIGLCENPSAIRS
jgi:hypothetical protein